MALWSMRRASFIVFTAFGSELVVWRYAGICSGKWCRNHDFFMQQQWNYYCANDSADGAFVVAVLCMQRTRDSLLTASRSELRLLFCDRVFRACSTLVDSRFFD